jgi:hypothetical protein
MKNTDTKPESAPDLNKAEVPPVVKPETGGPKGLEPTRYGDWENKGKCVDF